MSPSPSWPSWNRDGMSASSPPSGRGSAPSTGHTSPRATLWRKLGLAGMGLFSLLLAVAIWGLVQSPAPIARPVSPSPISSSEQLAWSQALQAWQSGILIQAPALPAHPGLRSSMQVHVDGLGQWQAIPARQALLGMLEKLETDTTPWWNQAQQNGESGPFVLGWATMQNHIRTLRAQLAGQDWLRHAATIEAMRAQVDASLRAFAASAETQQSTSIGQVWRLGVQVWFADQQQAGWTQLSAAQQAWAAQQSALLAAQEELVKVASSPAPVQAAVVAPPGWPAWLAALSWVGLLGSMFLWARGGSPARGWSEALPQDGWASHVEVLLDDSKRIFNGDMDGGWTQRPTVLAPLVESLNQILEAWRQHVAQAKTLANQMHQKTCDVGDSQETMLQQVIVQDRVLADVNEWIKALHQRALNSQSELAVMLKDVSSLVGQGVESSRHWQKARKGSEKALLHARETAKPLALLIQDMQELHDLGRVLHNLAEQMGVLAMQAALQAAKAGDAGKGFQVVAKEVQDAAHRAEEAATRVSAIVESDKSNLNALRTTMANIEEQADESMKRAEMANDASAGMDEGLQAVKSRSQELEDLVAQQSIQAQSVQEKLAEAPLLDANGAAQKRCGEAISEMINLARQSGENLSRFWSGGAS